MKKSETAEDTDVSHQEAVSIHFGAHGKTGPVLQEMTVSRLICLTGSQEAYALWVSMWLISASCMLAEVSSDPAHLIW